MSDEQTNLAQVKDLSVSFMTDAGSIKAIDKISFTIPRKTVVGVVGESDSGKSVTARSIIKLLPETATTSGAIYLSNREGNEQLDVLSLSGEDLRRMRGSEAAMVFQEPNSVLNPVYTIGWQIEEGLRAHGMKDKKELRAKSVDILKKVGIPDAETRIDYYPHQFSGGQKQRIGQKLVVRDEQGKVIERSKDWHDQPIAVEAKGLTITYPGHLTQPDFKAVNGIDFTIHRSEVLGLVGESGSGKSTTGRAIAGLQKVSGGSLNVLGVEMNGVKERQFKPKRADIGFVFQDPGSSFNPLMTIAENVAEPLIVHKKYSSVSEASDYVGDLLEMVQLPRAYMNRFPHELSGGQRQRASLARALALKPSLLIADEPTSALDVSVQAKVLELFKKLQAEIGFACLFITHDLAVVDMLADRIMVMHKGEIVEHGDADQVMNNPQNPYTQKLLASLPVPDPREQRKHRAQLHELLAKGI